MDIPITFMHKGKQYTGYLSKVSGAGTHATYHLMIDNFYRGQLVHTDHYGWQFTSQDMILAYKSEEFGKHVEAANK